MGATANTLLYQGPRFTSWKQLHGIEALQAPGGVMSKGESWLGSDVLKIWPEV